MIWKLIRWFLILPAFVLNALLSGGFGYWIGRLDQAVDVSHYDLQGGRNIVTGLSVRVLREHGYFSLERRTLIQIYKDGDFKTIVVLNDLLDSNCQDLLEADWLAPSHLQISYDKRSRVVKDLKEFSLNNHEAKLTLLPRKSSCG